MCKPRVFHKTRETNDGHQSAATWGTVSGLVASEVENKPLLLAAIEAAACIRPEEAGLLLADLLLSEDEDIVDAAHEAITLAQDFEL